MALSDLTQSLAADPTYGTSDPETIKRRQLMAAALINQGTSTEPIRSPWQGAANLAKALMGGADSAMADMAEQRGRKSVLPDLNTAIQPRAVTTPSQAMTTADATPGTNYRDAISSVESGGKYDAIGPDTGGDRAYGRYQVMGANIPAWTKAALGREMTPQEFLADPKAQDATFDHRFGQYVQQYGNPQDAASVWFSGRPMAKAGNASDVLGTTVPGYVAKFNAALGKPQGTQVASADTSFAPQSNQPDFSGAPMPPPRPDDVGMPNSVRPVAQFTNAPVADATDAADGEDKPAPAQVAQAAPAAAQSPMADPRVAAAYRVASNPWATPAQQQIAMTIIKDAMNPKEKYGDPYTDDKGNYVQRGPDGKIQVLQAAKDQQDRTPSSVQEYEYAKKNGFTGSFQDWKQQGGANGGSPATVQEYKFYQDQEKAAGREPVSFNDYQKQKAAKFANFDPETRRDLVNFIADRTEAGDTKARIGYTHNPGLLAEVDGELARRDSERRAAGKPTMAETILKNQAEQSGRVAGARTGYSLNTRMDVYSKEANTAMDLALETSRNLPRTGFVPLNKAIQMVQSNTGSPELAQHVAQINAVINTYAKAINPTGVPTQSDKDHAREVLNAAQTPEQFEAVIRQLQREIAVAHKSARSVKDLGAQEVSEPPSATTPSQAPGSQSTGIMDSIKSLFTSKNPAKTSTGVQWHIEGQ